MRGLSNARSMECCSVLMLAVYSMIYFVIPLNTPVMDGSLDIKMQNNNSSFCADKKQNILIAGFGAAEFLSARYFLYSPPGRVLKFELFSIAGAKLVPCNPAIKAAAASRSATVISAASLPALRNAFLQTNIWSNAGCHLL